MIYDIIINIIKLYCYYFVNVVFPFILTWESTFTLSGRYVILTLRVSSITSDI